MILLGMIGPWQILLLTILALAIPTGIFVLGISKLEKSIIFTQKLFEFSIKDKRIGYFLKRSSKYQTAYLKR